MSTQEKETSSKDGARVQERRRNDTLRVKKRVVLERAMGEYE